MSGWTPINSPTGASQAGVRPAVDDDHMDVESDGYEDYADADSDVESFSDGYEDGANPDTKVQRFSDWYEERANADADVESLDHQLSQESDIDEDMPDIPPAPAQVPAAVLASSSAAAAFPASAGAQDSVTDPSATSGTPAVLDFGPSSLDLLNLQAVHKEGTRTRFGKRQVKIIVQWMVESGHYKVYYKELEDKIAFEVDFASLIELLGFDHPDFPETMQHQLEEMVKGKINRLWRKMRNMGALLPVYLPNGALGRGQYTWAEFTQRWAAEDWDGRMV